MSRNSSSIFYFQAKILSISFTVDIFYDLQIIFISYMKSAEADNQYFALRVNMKYIYEIQVLAI